MPEYGLESEYRVECDRNGIKWRVENYKDGVGISFAEENSVLEIVEIPEELGGKPVLALLDKAFYKNSSIKEVRIPDTVNKIGEEAFYQCGSLKSVNIPEGIKELSKWCFAYCNSLEELNGLEHIVVFDSYCFYKALTVFELILEQEIEFIGYYSFSECNIEKLYMGHIVHAGKMSFARCDSLREVYFCDNAKAVPAYFFFECRNLEKISLNCVTAIGEYAFGKCSRLKELKLPASLIKIGANILFQNQMKLVIVPEKYEEMTYGESAAEIFVRPTVSVLLKYNEYKWKDETKVIYYGERINTLPLLETKCREMTGWYESPTKEEISEEFLELLVLKYGEWFRKGYEATLQPYDFTKPIYSNLSLYAQWQIKENETGE